MRVSEFLTHARTVEHVSALVPGQLLARGGTGEEEEEERDR